MNAYELTRRIYAVDSWWQPVRHRFRRWSSYDPAGNTLLDYDKFVRVSGNTAVLAETPESGAIVRIWAASDVNRQVRMFQGGAGQPFLDAPLPALFDGSFNNRTMLHTGVDFNVTDEKHWPFVPPFTRIHRGAHVCRVPIPFRDGLRVEADLIANPRVGLFYHIDCLLADDVRGFDGRFCYRDFTVRQAEAIHANPLAFYADELLGARRLPLQGRGDRVTLLRANGAGMVRRLAYRLTDVSLEHLHDLRLTISYGDRPPSFHTPVSLLYCAAFELHAFRSRALGYEDGVFTFQFPIPFRDGITIALESVTGRTFGVEGEALLLDREPPADALLLHSHSAFDVGPDPRRYVFANMPDAAGRYVGMVFSCKPYQQEDNEIITVDGEVVARGTGREDYFNMAWGFKEHCEPDHGCPVQSGEWPWQDLQCGHGYYSAYRLHFNESIPFRHSFEAAFEKDHDPGKIGHGWASTAFLYLTRPQPANAIPEDWRSWARLG
ncbi:MAG: hypothetical protein PCFJNLEI_02059 [Verrucomicrobiae bacterium]|nr:hypothetical protein [Verrucomicrobiae bacterium]